MSQIKGKPIHRYCLIAGMLVFGILLAYSPARADEEPPLEEGELEAYQPADPSPEPAGAPICNPDIPGMIAYWPLNDPETPVNNKLTFQNYMGTSNGICTLPGCPDRVSGKVGGAYNFLYADPYDPDDAPDTITVPYFSDLDWDLADSFSFETWVKIPNGGTCGPDNQVFIGRRGLGTFSVWLGCTSANKVRFSVRDSDLAQTLVESDNQINDGIWHHIVGVRDAANAKLHLYIDGALEKSVNTAFVNGFSGNSNMSLGHFLTHAPPFYYLVGSLDEVAVYEKAVTLAEVQSHWNGGNGKSYCSAGPVVTDPGDQTDREGDTVSLQIQASDQDPGTLEYTASALPEGLALNRTTGRISGRLTCDASEGSPYDITVTVRNISTDRSGSTNFSWTVNEFANCVTRQENYIPAVLKGGS
jgi:hypothetical protein